MMRNRKIWLIIKAAFILVLSFSYYYNPPAESYRRYIRIAIIVVFTISFLYDLYKYQEKKS